MDVEMKETDSEQSQADGPPKKDDTAPKPSANAYELPWYCFKLYSKHFNVAKDSKPVT